MQVRAMSGPDTRGATTCGGASRLPLPAERPVIAPGLRVERSWRQPTHGESHGDLAIIASRWTGDVSTARAVRHTGRAGRYIIAVALRPVRMRLGHGTDWVFDGVMPSGMIHVTEPRQVLDAEFFTPYDFVHFHVDAAIVRDCQAMAVRAEPRLRDLMLRDDLTTQLSRTLTEDPHWCDAHYAQSVGQTILMRIMALRPATPVVGALPKWRLRRVQEHIAANLAEPISLADLGEVAGLSRMHFAAQFRAATGCRPHEYLLQCRIECAKTMLAHSEASLVEVALATGFHTQSHFSTVFKRLAGSTPACWQRTQRIGDAGKARPCDRDTGPARMTDPP